MNLLSKRSLDVWNIIPIIIHADAFSIWLRVALETQPRKSMLGASSSGAQIALAIIIAALVKKDAADGISSFLLGLQKAL